MSNSNESSGSLVIIQGNNEFQVNSSSSKLKKEDDLFELSRDDLTLSFQIEEQKPIGVIEIAEDIYNKKLEKPQQPVKQQENKRKRKQIFDKFKRPPNNLPSKVENSNSETNLLDIFDSIFKIKSPESSRNNPTSRQPKIQEISVRPFSELNPRDRTPSAERRERLKIFGKKTVISIQNAVLTQQLLNEVNGSQIKQSESNINQNYGSPITTNKSSLNFSNIEKKFSEIYVTENHEVSRDSIQIGDILQSQIFKNQEPILLTKQEKKQQKQIRQVLVIKEPQINLPLLTRAQIFPVFTSRTQIKQIQPISKLQIFDRQITSPLQFYKNQPVDIPLAIQRPNLPLSNKRIEQSRLVNNDFSYISSASNPSINVQTYQEQKGSRFIPENSMVNCSSPMIGDCTINTGDKKQNFQFGKNLAESYVIETQPVIVNQHIFEEQIRMPVFLRKIRQHISIYPNFYILNNSPNTSECIRQQFNELFDLYSNAVTFLSQMCQKVLDAKSVKKLYLGQLMSNLTYQLFMESGWEKHKVAQTYELIRPMEPIQMREWSYQKAKTALTNYQTIIGYYRNKGIKLDLTCDKGRRKYFQIRQKFWDIAGNMKLISEDIYCEMKDCQFPSHYYEYLSFLRQDFPVRLSDDHLCKNKNLMNQFKNLKLQKDLLIKSQVGLKIKEKLQLWNKYLHPF